MPYQHSLRLLAAATVLFTTATACHDEAVKPAVASPEYTLQSAMSYFTTDGWRRTTYNNLATPDLTLGIRETENGYKLLLNFKGTRTATEECELELPLNGPDAMPTYKHLAGSHAVRGNPSNPTETSQAVVRYSYTEPGAAFPVTYTNKPSAAAAASLAYGSIIITRYDAGSKQVSGTYSVTFPHVRDPRSSSPSATGEVELHISGTFNHVAVK